MIRALPARANMNITAELSRSGTGETQYRILVIDDEPDSLRILLEMMRACALELASAPNATIGLRNARAFSPDLILLDVMLPDGDGFALCRALKATRETQDIPVIFLSAKAMVDDKAAGFAAGGVDYITKPFEAKEVLLRVVNHLWLAQRDRTLRERLAQYEPPSSLRDRALPPIRLPPETPPGILRILIRARDRLLSDLCNPPNLDTLAAFACTNRTTLGQLFKRYLRMTVFDYLREQRLNEGRRLLQTTGLSVTAIAEQVGYRYGRDFAGAFKDRFGVSPVAYREQESGQ
jgi:DNA-binding response OmpR family regulator